ncbi:MAG TPA: DUF4384 domain-containing protein [Bacteroidales bacterium]|nr:DUF4384 domain-containing protein [Bacteroidales bacterium]
MGKSIVCLALVLSMCGMVLYAQEDTLINLTAVAGVGYSNTVENSRSKAIDDAKTKALRMACIDENISTYTDYFRAETDQNYQELFSSQVFTQMKGVVRNVEVISESKEFIEGDNIKTEVVIDCTVMKFNTEPDLLYKAAIEGVKPVYYSGDALSFSVKVSSDSYLKIFCIPESKENAYFLFPNDYERDFVLKADEMYSFPFNLEMYEMMLDGTGQQTDRFIFILTKEPYPYYKPITYSDIVEWIFDIPINKRIVESFAVSIYPR